jgi:hypothetical protein
LNSIHTQENDTGQPRGLSHLQRGLKQQVGKERKSTSSLLSSGSASASISISSKPPLPDPTRLISRLTALENALSVLENQCRSIATKRGDVVRNVVLKQNQNVARIEDLLSKTTSKTIINKSESKSYGSSTTNTTARHLLRGADRLAVSYHSHEQRRNDNQENDDDTEWDELVKEMNVQVEMLHSDANTDAPRVDKM